MARAVILPFPGDPFLLNYWLKYFDRFWEKEIDKLYIYHNSPAEPAVAYYIKELCEQRPKIHLAYTPMQMEHGEVINRALDLVQEDLVMLVEDDGFIFKSRIVDYAFRSIESGQNDIVGSKRGSCHQEILDAAKDKWGLSYEGYGDQGPNFWPCYFFTKVSLLKQTTRRFGAMAWSAGEVITPLGHVTRAPVVYSDTFVNASLELRAMIPQDRIAILPQYHASPDDFSNYEKKIGIFDGKAPWTHIGSLSTGVGGVLKDDFNRALISRKITEPKGETKLEDCVKTDQEKLEWERRVCWWLTFWENRETGKIEEFAGLYKVALDRVIRTYGLHIKTMRRLQRIYRELGLL